MSASRKLGPGPLIVASHNPGKVREINALVSHMGIAPKSASKLGLSEPEETGETFSENAILKARAASQETKLPALADDSGLAVAGLGGAPGIYSARWAGPDKDFALAIQKVEEALREAGGDDYSAHFVCVLALAWPDDHIEVFEGQVFGDLSFPPRGENGFGYDPIFTPKGRNETFGEMDPAQKHAMSHRAAAFQKLKRACLDT
ncbi:MAG: RdgB/HAM1 family non-canonical purine NTP pyrophosphatase [Pseudomonadota bacterium]